MNMRVTAFLVMGNKHFQAVFPVRQILQNQAKSVIVPSSTNSRKAGRGRGSVGNREETSVRGSERAGGCEWMQTFRVKMIHVKNHKQLMPRCTKTNLLLKLANLKD